MTPPFVRLLQVLAVLVLVLAFGPLATPAGAQDDDDGGCNVVGDDDDDDDDEGGTSFCDNQAIVRLGPNAKPGRFMNDYRLRVVTSIPARRTYLVRFGPTSNDRAVAQRLDRDRRTAWAELNYVDEAPEGRPRYVYRSTPTVPTEATSPYALDLIGVPVSSCATGANVTVAVVDTGVDADHPEFDGRVLPGRNVFNRSAGNTDPAAGAMGGHGTHVAGIVAQVAPDAAILPVKALNQDGVGSIFYLAKAIDFASVSDAQVINLSLGTTQNARVVREAIVPAISRGAVIVAAAGNSGAQTPMEFPASLAPVLGVASTDQNDERSNFSTNNAAVDISAPGTEIVSAFPNGEYRTWSGTSMATPWVAGAAALLIERGVAPTDVVAVLTDPDNVDPVRGGATGMGAGRLNVGKAVGCGA